jgi:enoyl-CoA hydratase/carnithine racemase
VLNVERHEGSAVVIWTVDRPAAKNALDHATMDALVTAVREAAYDRELRAAVITGAGHVFVSGGDLRELRQRTTAEDAERLSDAGYELMTAIGELPFPVIAALPGPAIGGGAELALACDMRVADVRARISFKQVRMGVTTAWGTVPRLTSVVGAGTAARLLLTGHEISAAEAKLLGLVDEVTENGLARTTAIAWACDVALGSPKAASEMKRLLRESIQAPESVRALERRVFVDTWTGADHIDAVEAYFEHRPPKFGPR